MWSKCCHAISRWHLHSCYCTVTSLSLSGLFNCWQNEIRWDNNPANAIKQCFIHALIPLEARGAFVISARGKKVQQKLSPCWTETIRAGLISSYSASGCEVALASKPLTHLHHVVTTKWLWQLWWIRPPVVPLSQIDMDLLQAQSSVMKISTHNMKCLQANYATVAELNRSTRLLLLSTQWKKKERILVSLAISKLNPAPLF